MYPADVQMIWPVAGRGHPRQRHVSDSGRMADARWRDSSWRTGTKGKLKARFAAGRVRVANGPPQSDQGQGSATSAKGRGLAHRRTQDVGREEILSRQPAGEH